MTEYQIETGLTNWLDGGEITNVEADLDDFMSNVIDASEDDLSEVERENIEAFARHWIEARVEQR